MDNTTIKFITTNMPWKNVLFKDIVERVALTNTSENLPYIEFEDIISGEGTLNKDILDCIHLFCPKLYDLLCLSIFPVHL